MRVALLWLPVTPVGWALGSRASSTLGDPDAPKQQDTDQVSSLPTPCVWSCPTVDKGSALVSGPRQRSRPLQAGRAQAESIQVGFQPPIRCSHWGKGQPKAPTQHRGDSGHQGAHPALPSLGSRSSPDICSTSWPHLCPRPGHRSSALHSILLIPRVLGEPEASTLRSASPAWHSWLYPSAPSKSNIQSGSNNQTLDL